MNKNLHVLVNLPEINAHYVEQHLPCVIVFIVVVVDGIDQNK